MNSFHCFRKLPALVAASLMLPALAYADKNDRTGEVTITPIRGEGKRTSGRSACFVRSGAEYSVGIVTLYGCGFGSWLHASLAPAKERLCLATNSAKD